MCATPLAAAAAVAATATSRRRVCACALSCANWYLSCWWRQRTFLQRTHAASPSTSSSGECELNFRFGTKCNQISGKIHFYMRLCDRFLLACVFAFHAFRTARKPMFTRVFFMGTWWCSMSHADCVLFLLYTRCDDVVVVVGAAFRSVCLKLVCCVCVLCYVVCAPKREHSRSSQKASKCAPDATAAALPLHNQTPHTQTRARVEPKVIIYWVTLSENEWHFRRLHVKLSFTFQYTYA